MDTQPNPLPSKKRRALKRLVDIFLALGLLILLCPLLFLILAVVFFSDKRSPVYFSRRSGLNGEVFSLVKVRSMIVNAEDFGSDSTSEDDARVTSIGKLIRRFKLDELPQLINVLKGEMSLVGPRPNTVRESLTYSLNESLILGVRPGITDFASVVFANEGKLLAGSEDVDDAYRRLIRPHKISLGLFYISKISLFLDFKIIIITVLNFFSRRRAKNAIKKLLLEYGYPKEQLDFFEWVP